jgi:hypothetical protein
MKTQQFMFDVLDDEKEALSDIAMMEETVHCNRCGKEQSFASAGCSHASCGGIFVTGSILTFKDVIDARIEAYFLLKQKRDELVDEPCNEDCQHQEGFTILTHAARYIEKNRAKLAEEHSSLKEC